MRFLALTAAFSIGVANVAQAATLACSSCGLLRGAPAPEIGSGISVPLAAGAVLCGMMLVKSWRRS
jgi:hypothetical protein